MSFYETEYSKRFDELRENRVQMSFYKYGSAKRNYGEGLSNALDNMDLCIRKYRDTHNTEYLCDAANYLMFEFMYPQFKDAHFRATSSEESAGITGFCIKEIENFGKDQV